LQARNLSYSAADRIPGLFRGIRWPPRNPGCRFLLLRGPGADSSGSTNPARRTSCGDRRAAAVVLLYSGATARELSDGCFLTASDPNGW